MSSAASSKVVISGTGLWTSEHSITNEELVIAYNGWAEKYNQDHFKQIEDGSLKAKPFSTEEFIEKGSGIKQRYVYVKDGILDINQIGRAHV